MKSILETLALGATLAALTSLANAATTTSGPATPSANPPVVHVASTTACPQHVQTSSPSGATKGAADEKEDCTGADNATPAAGTSGGNRTQTPSH